VIIGQVRKIRAIHRDAKFRKSPGPIYLAVSMIFLNEARYLREWLDFHLSVGVEHFYLYDNGSTDHYADELESYLVQGLVTLIDWPQVPGQRTAYEHCIQHNAMAARWIAFIDADEFLYAPVGADVRTVLKLYEQCPAIKVARYEFGSSGHKTRPLGSILSNYVLRHGRARGAGKSINNPRLVRRIKGAHSCRFYGSGSPKRCDTLRINHYWSRSLEDLSEKYQKTGKGIAQGWQGRSFSMRELLEREAADNEVEDRLIIDIANTARTKPIE
jgi:hypothetical protein